RASTNGASRSRPAPMPLHRTSGGPGLCCWRSPPLARAGWAPGRTDTRTSCPRTVTRRLREGADTGDVPSDDEGLDGLRAFVRVQRLHVGHVPHDVEVEQDAVAAEQVPGRRDD